MIWLPFSSTRLPAALVTWNPLWDTFGRARADLRGDVPVAEQALEAAVAARLVGQHVRRRRVGLGWVWPNFTPVAEEQNVLPWAQCTPIPT